MTPGQLRAPALGANRPWSIRGIGGWSLVLLAGCSRSPGPLQPVVDASPTPDTPAILHAVRVAADVRRGGDIPSEAARSRDPVVRRARAQALARILDDDGASLLRALDDEDDEVVAWAAYGLGESCKGHDDRATALAARLQSLGDAPESKSRVVILRALGRCGTDVAEAALRPWLGVTLSGDDARAFAMGEAASFALGEMAARRGGLSTETVAALLGAVERSHPLKAAFYPFTRGDVPLQPAQAARLLAAVRSELVSPGVPSPFALGVLGLSVDSESVHSLSALLRSGDAPWPTRVEAAHALGRMKGAGQTALAEALGALGHFRPDELEGSGRVNLVLTVIESLTTAGVAQAQDSLWALTRLEAPAGMAPPGLRRISKLRCAAAGKLARAAWESEVLGRCDLGDGEIGARALLDAIGVEEAPLNRARRAALAELARSTHARIREAALDLMARHPEMAEVARTILAEALAAPEPGVVAKAASVLQAHPMRELDGPVAAALRVALAHPWSRDLIETRAAIIEAALALGLPEGRGAAETACRDDNPTLRARVAKAVSTAGLSGVRCAPPEERGQPAPEIGHELTTPIRIALDTDAGPLVLRLDPVGAPVAVSRVVALARAGFYSGLSFHRVLPGYLAQFGDPGGDGFGGSGDWLRCETSPIPFERGDIGVALAGRDTGSSQLFVTLARTPSLDGEYAWLGHAEGDWDAVVEGDIIRAARVEPP